MLHDGADRAGLVAKHATIARGVVHRCRQDGGDGARPLVFVEQADQRVTGQQWGVGGEHDHRCVVNRYPLRPDLGQGDANRMAGAALLCLNHGHRPGCNLSQVSDNVLTTMADHDHDLCRLQGFCRSQHMAKQRATGNRVQDLGQG